MIKLVLKRVMNDQILDRSAELLNDTGKCNNLVNYRKNKSGLEVLLPDVESLFDLLGQNRTFIVFDPFIPGKDK